MSLVVGDSAPEFSAVDQHGHSHRSADYQGQWVILYFYPKDGTPGCTQEACAIRDRYDLLKTHARIFGISTDSITSHQKFADKHRLPFPLLADPDKTIVQTFGVYQPKKIFGKEILGTHRTTFIINPSGIITKIYRRVIPATHAETLLTDLKELKEE